MPVIPEIQPQLTPYDNSNMITVRRLLRALQRLWVDITGALADKADTADVEAIQTRLTTAENNIANLSPSGASYTEATTNDIDQIMMFLRPVIYSSGSGGASN